VRIFKVLPRESRESVVIHRSNLLATFDHKVETTRESKAFVAHKYATKVQPPKRRG